MTARFIAEISSNHHQDVARCLRFIDTAADIGCDGVKFQLFTVETLFHPVALAVHPQLQARRAWELPRAFLPTIAQRCQERGMLFGCSPFYLEAVTALLPFVNFYKIASYELPWDALLRACAQTGRTVVLSTGMATIPEIMHAVEVLSDAECTHLTLLHCVSGYPTPLGECNLGAIASLRAFDVPVGLSDHSASPAVLYRAVQYWHADMVEFHLDLDGTGDEYQTGHCWLPEQIALVIKMVRDGEITDGDGRKQPQPSELADRAWRREPSDGLRPMLATRIALQEQAWVSQ